MIPRSGSLGFSPKADVGWGGEEIWRRRRGANILVPAQVADGPKARAGVMSAPLPASGALPLPLNEPAVREPRARRAVQAQAPRPGGCRSGSPPLAAAPHRASAAVPRAMDLPRSLLMAWALSLWPGTCLSCLPLASGRPSLAREGLGSSCQERDAVRLPGSKLGYSWGRGSPGNWLQPSGSAKFRKRKRRAEAIWSWEFGVFRKS